ncbi:uncharacterized protein [Leuresthes tenuis]|uniref:uncharacterized protein n=1 Tax=Leuresthes tenuis TaxID=355514 RepID=UPI003B5054FF
MDCAEIKAEMAAEELLEPLVITEDGDMTECVTAAEAASGSDAIEQSCGEESAFTKTEKRSGEETNQEAVASKMCLEEEKHQTAVLEGHSTENQPEPSNESKSDGQNRDDSEGQTLNVTMKEGPSDTEDDKAAQNDHGVDEKRLEQQPEGAGNREEDPKKANRLTPDFPESLYELLCTLQEGRRLNDQRCSFRLEGGLRRRRCHSEPNTTKPAHRVMFSSMTSLQKEEFFELVATAQARRIDDQRAQLERSPPPKSKARSFRGSLKQLSFVKKPAAVPVPKEDLYDMILTTQAQGRLEDQRSRAPGPMDDEDFFSLLLRVQGGRMDEQRTELPCLLQT